MVSGTFGTTRIILSLPISRMFLHIPLGSGSGVARSFGRFSMRPNTSSVSVCPWVISEKTLSQIRMPSA